MKKKRALILLSLCLTGTAIYAQDFRFGWSFGSIKLYGDAINSNFNFDVDLGQLYLIKNRFSVGLNGLGFYDALDEDAYRFLILPLEIAFLPLNYKDSIFISAYGKTGWELTRNKDNNKFSNELYGAIGMKLFFFPEIFPEILPRCSFYFSVFAEYDIHKKFKIGVGIDLAALAFLGLVGAHGAVKERYEQLYPEDRRPPYGYKSARRL